MGRVRTNIAHCAQGGGQDHRAQLLATGKQHRARLLPRKQSGQPKLAQCAILMLLLYFQNSIIDDILADLCWGSVQADYTDII